MSNLADAPDVPDTPWQAEFLRLTGLLPSAESNAAPVWAAVTGDEPEVTRQQRGVEKTAEGPFRDHRLTLAVRPERTDWTLSPQMPEDLTVAFPSLGLLPTALELIQSVADKWTESELCPSFQRIALGAGLLLPVADRIAGYKAIQSFLPSVQLDPGNSFEFSYQINRPRSIDLTGQNIRINRLATWSVALLKVRVLALDSPRAPITPSGALTACKLVMDINTDAEFTGELTRQQTQQWFRHFSELAVEISEQGDRP